jgi:protein-disulfide isomerase
MRAKIRLWPLVLSGLLPVPLAAETPGAEPTAMTREQGDAILRELQQIRLLLERLERQERAAVPPARRGPPLRARVSVADRPSLGEPDAPVTLVAFVDYECPFCRKFFRTTYQRLKEDYVDPGRVRLVVKDLPLELHKLARRAAQAAHCAGEQDAFWPMHDRLLAGEAGLNEGALRSYAEGAGLDPERFRGCLGSGRHLGQIDADIAEAKAAGISGTPAFVIGPSDEEAVEGVHVRGALPLRVFKGHIDRLLGPERVPR